MHEDDDDYTNKVEPQGLQFKGTWNLIQRERYRGGRT